MIMRTTLKGPAGGKKECSKDQLKKDEALDSLRHDLDMGFEVIQVSDGAVLTEFYEPERQFTDGLHHRYEGTTKEMKSLVRLAQTKMSIGSPA